MATKVYNVETIELQDGTEVTIKPLTIKRLRRFMEVVKEFETVDENDAESINIMVKACAIALEVSSPDLAKNTDKLEDALDIPTMWKILEVAGGVTPDPNLLTPGL